MLIDITLACLTILMLLAFPYKACCEEAAKDGAIIVVPVTPAPAAETPAAQIVPIVAPTKPPADSSVLEKGAAATPVMPAATSTTPTPPAATTAPATTTPAAETPASDPKAAAAAVAKVKVHRSGGMVVADYLSDGAYLLQQGNYQAAIRRFQQAVAMDGTNARASHYLEMANQKVNALKTLRQKFEDLVIARPHSAIDHHSLARTCLELQDYEAAISEYKKALAINDNLTEAHYDLASAYFESGQYDEAKIQIDKVIAKSPDHQDALYLAGRLSEKNKDYEEASKYYNKALELDEHDLKSMTRLAWVEIESGNALDGETRLKEVIKINPHYFEALYVLGKVYEDNKVFDEAFSYLGKALQVNPYDAGVHFELGRLFFALQQYSSSVDQFHKTIFLDESFPKAKEWLQKALNRKRGT